MTLAGDLGDLVQEHRVHRRIYTDAAIFEEEMSSVFAGTWVFVGHESQVPERGDWRRVEVGRRPVLLTRDQDGEIHALLDRCAHRGAMLTREPGGCAKRFTCAYHGWSFALDGRLVAVPYPGNYAALDRENLGLGRLAVASHRGFVFATLTPDPPPLLEWLGDAAAYIDTLVDDHHDGSVRVLPSAVRLEYAGNWKLAWDNAADGLHATFAHRSYNDLAAQGDVDSVLARDPASTPMVARSLGHGHMVVDQRPGIEAGPWSTMRPMPFGDELVDAVRARSGTDAAAAAALDRATGTMVNLSLFPNLIFVGNQLLVVEPIAVDRTRLVLHLLVGDELPPEVNLLRLRVDEDFVSFGTPDDLEMFERVQAGLAIPEMEWVDVSRGLGSPSDIVEADGRTRGPITSEGPQRGYLREYRRLLERAAVPRVR